jgi:hypothetical protein
MCKFLLNQVYQNKKFKNLPNALFLIVVKFGLLVWPDCYIARVFTKAESLAQLYEATVQGLEDYNDKTLA